MPNLTWCVGLARQDAPSRNGATIKRSSARPAYGQLFEIGCCESSYAVRLAAAQEIGSGGQDALADLQATHGFRPASQGQVPDGGNRAARRGER